MRRGVIPPSCGEPVESWRDNAEIFLKYPYLKYPYLTNKKPPLVGRFLIEIAFYFLSDGKR